MAYFEALSIVGNRSLKSIVLVITASHADDLFGVLMRIPPNIGLERWDL